MDGIFREGLFLTPPGSAAQRCLDKTKRPLFFTRTRDGSYGMCSVPSVAPGCIWTHATVTVGAVFRAGLRLEGSWGSTLLTAPSSWKEKHTEQILMACKCPEVPPKVCNDGPPGDCYASESQLALPHGQNSSMVTVGPDQKKTSQWFSGRVMTSTSSRR